MLLILISSQQSLRLGTLRIHHRSVPAYRRQARNGRHWVEGCTQTKMGIQWMKLWKNT